VEKHVSTEIEMRCNMEGNEHDDAHHKETHQLNEDADFHLYIVLRQKHTVPVHSMVSL
jgi:hypothetical protein